MNETREVRSPVDWDNQAVPHLWRYNLHYFDDLNAAGKEQRAEWHRALIARWMAENPPPAGTAWEPYPTSLRIVNWIKWALGGGELETEAEASLALQAQWLSRRIETHLLGNHLFCNAKALVFAGLFFEGEPADRWLKRGREILKRELPEQVLEDGGHFERSTMYHSLAFEDVLDLVNLGRAFGNRQLLEWLEPRVPVMASWLAAMCHPDGEIALFNDAAFGIAPPPAALFDYAVRLGFAGAKPPREGITQLAGSGYVRLQRGPWVVLFDAAPVGPDYLPGHAHADTLSFELSYGANRVICNSGTSRYGLGPIREWERSTAAHNTVEIDGENSSEVWHGFRVARRAYPRDLDVGREELPLRVACSHDGYTRLKGRPVHRRTLKVHDHAVTWIDEVRGTGEHKAVGRIPLHPDVKAERVGEARWRLIVPGERTLLLEAHGPGVRLASEAGRYSPEFGLTHERTVLRWQLEGELPLLVQCRLAIEKP